MGGIYIDCGSFAGEDKSGSAILGVLEGMQPMAGPTVRVILGQLSERVQIMLQTQAPTVTEIHPNEASALLPDLRRYRAKLEQRLGPMRDPHTAIHNDRVAGDAFGMGTARKWGAGLGWQYFCVLDLERAFDTSVADQEAVVLSWD
jgi:hypothetical protein